MAFILSTLQCLYATLDTGGYAILSNGGAMMSALEMTRMILTPCQTHSVQCVVSTGHSVQTHSSYTRNEEALSSADE